MTETTNNLQGGRWRVAVWSIAAVLMVLPLLAMQVTDEVAWDGVDFAILAALLLGFGITFELAVRKNGNTFYRFGVIVALLAAFLLIAGNLAVGVIGSENNPANLMFVGVLAVGLMGSLLARVRPLGMARAMVATALIQVIVAVIALALGSGSRGPIWPLDILGATAVFTALWLLSAWLFRSSAKADPGD